MTSLRFLNGKFEPVLISVPVFLFISSGILFSGFITASPEKSYQYEIIT